MRIRSALVLVLGSVAFLCIWLRLNTQIETRVVTRSRVRWQLPAQTSLKPRFAYATLLSSDSFLPGTLALLASLRMSGTQEDIVVLVLDSISEHSVDILSLAGARILRIDAIENPYARSMVARRQRYNFSKLRIWQLTQYTKIIMMGIYISKSKLGFGFMFNV